MANPTDAPASPADARADRPWRDWALMGGIFAPVVVIALIVAASSYYHEYELAHRNGQPPWVSKALPFTVDGLVLAAAIALLWGRAHGILRPPRPLFALAVGAGATIAANLFSALSFWWLRPAVSAWAGVAALLVGDVGMWWVGERRKLAEPDQPDTAADRPYRPPPVTLAEALLLARDELKSRGENSGEQALADRFEIPRSKVRARMGAAGTQTPAPAVSDASVVPPADVLPPGPAPSPNGRVSV